MSEFDVRTLSVTKSVCPVCLRPIEARRVMRNGRVFMDKTCPEHGDFSALIWGGQTGYEQWANTKLPSVPPNPAEAVNRGCPYDCGLCPEHKNHTCCVLLEVTQRCNLCCPTCFASAQSEGSDMSMEDIALCFDGLMEMGGPFNIQLSGGEPTVREDLDAIIKLGRSKGFDFFQLNTNGIRIAEDIDYLRRIVDAGLSCVFLQFDGVDDYAYQALRGKKLFDVKCRAIKNCEAVGVGVVLVPTIAPDVNTAGIGDILRFAKANVPAVRGVHFQPISYFGRIGQHGAENSERTDRFTLSDLLYQIDSQTNGEMAMELFSAGGAENAYCSFSANFIVDEEGRAKPWTPAGTKTCGCGVPTAGDASKKARKFVAKRWSARNTRSEAPCCCGTSSLDAFLEKLETRTLAVSAMAFMDAWNLDIDRLRDCYIHVVRADKGKVRLIPFCAYNLTAQDGTTLYRGKEL